MFPKVLAAVIVGAGCMRDFAGGLRIRPSSPTISSNFLSSRATSWAQRAGFASAPTQECDKTAPKPAGFDMLINFDLDFGRAHADRRSKTSTSSPRRLPTTSCRRRTLRGRGLYRRSRSEQYNLGLSERRAQAVTDFLLEEGVSTGKVTAVGMGEANPRVADPLDAVNRRVEMRIELQ